MLFCSTLNGQNTGDTLQSSNDQPPKFTIDGELRSRLRRFNNINFGDVPLSANDYDTELNLRGIITGDLHLNKSIRLSTQLISAYTFLKDNISSKDRDLFAIRLLFIDVNFNKIPVGFTLGRQELNFGSGKILGASTGPNVTENFNGLKFSVDLNNVYGNLFYVKPDNIQEGIFDNTIRTDNIIYGSYLTIDPDRDHVLDLYFFGNYRKNISVEDITANEDRYTLGGRLYKVQGSLTYEAEAAWQSGNFDHKKISAFYASTSVGYNWQNARLKPGVRITGTIYSGDKDTTDRKMNIFRPVRARPPINRRAPIGPSNILTLISQGSLSVSSTFEIVVRYYLVWRYSANDGLYSISLEHITREPDINGEQKGLFVTSGFTAQFNYSINNHIEITFDTGWFFAGNYVRNTGIGKNPYANYLIAYYRF